MANIGIIKEFDKLGRLVIPKDLRERYALDNKVEIVATEQGVLIKSPEYNWSKGKREIERSPFFAAPCSKRTERISSMYMNKGENPTCGFLPLFRHRRKIHPLSDAFER